MTHILQQTYETCNLLISRAGRASQNLPFTRRLAHRGRDAKPDTQPPNTASTNGVVVMTVSTMAPKVDDVSFGRQVTEVRTFSSDFTLGTL
jgi:hypothetical protein